MWTRYFQLSSKERIDEIIFIFVGVQSDVIICAVCEEMRFGSRESEVFSKIVGSEFFENF